MTTISDDDAKALAGFIDAADIGGEVWTYDAEEMAIVDASNDDRQQVARDVAPRDAALIVAAVNALPTLLDEREALKAEIASLQSEADAIADRANEADDELEKWKRSERIASRRVADLGTKLLTAEAERDDANEAMRLHRENYVTVAAQRDALAAENARLRGEVKAYNDESVRQTRLLDTAIAKLAEVERERDAAGAHAMRLSVDEAGACDRIAQLEGELREATASRDACVARLLTLDRRAEYCIGCDRDVKDECEPWCVVRAARARAALPRGKGDK
jgi:chromosome segregation ATPase